MANTTEPPIGTVNERVSFKNLSRFASISEARKMVEMTGEHWRFDDEDCLCVSDIINNNCFIVRRQFGEDALPLYLCHFVGVTGHVELIKDSLDSRYSFDQAYEWLSSPDFVNNKERILSRNNVPMHEQDEGDVLRFCGQDRESLLYRKHKLFIENFQSWKSVRVNGHQA